MPKRLEFCMVCMESPCICNAKPARQPRTKKSQATAEPVPVKPDSPQPAARRGTNMRGAMKAAAATAPQRYVARPTDIEPTVAPRPTPRYTLGTDDELLERYALRLLNQSGLLGFDDKKKFSMILNGELSTREKLATWKAVRRARLATETQGQSAEAE